VSDKGGRGGAGGTKGGSTVRIAFSTPVQGAKKGEGKEKWPKEITHRKPAPLGAGAVGAGQVL